MKKVKVSKKQMKENYRILSVGYCDLQFLLKHKDPIAYSSGSYGWSCDYYDINGVVISTGYNPIKSKNVNDSYDLIKEYNEKARNIEYTTYEEMVSKLDDLLDEFIEKVKGV